MDTLLKKEGLPHLFGRPCERRLKSYNESKVKITATEESFQQVKRFIRVSLSVPRTSSKSSKDSAGSWSYPAP